jgi:hypothetical protein
MAEKFRVEFYVVSGIAQLRGDGRFLCTHVLSGKICQIFIWSETQQRQNYNEQKILLPS